MFCFNISVRAERSDFGPIGLITLTGANYMILGKFKLKYSTVERMFDSVKSLHDYRLHLACIGFDVISFEYSYNAG